MESQAFLMGIQAQEEERWSLSGKVPTQASYVRYPTSSLLGLCRQDLQVLS